MDLRDEHLPAVMESVLTSMAVRKLDLAHNPQLTDEGARVLVPAPYTTIMCNVCM